MMRGRPTPFKPTPVPVGISTGDWINGLNSGQQDLVFDRAVEVGASWFRETVNWTQVQPSNSSTFDWSKWDAILPKLAARNIRPLACIGGTPAWAGAPGGSNPPTSDVTWATFVTAAVNRYKASIKHWEIWNEPNHPPFWGMAPVDPPRYATLLHAAYDAAKAEDPTCTVIAGGTSPNLTDANARSPADWYDQIFDEGAGAWCDAIAHHPYTYPVLPTFVHDLNAWRQMYDTTVSIGSVLTAHGLSKKLWLTEFGAPTNGPGNQGTVANNYGDGLNADHVDQDLQGKILEVGITEMRKRPDRFAALFIYQSHDIGTDPADREQWFGLRSNADAAKEAFGDVKAKIAATGGR